jgi:hypothetical protein
MKKLLTILLFATGISLAVAQDSAPYFLSYQGRVTDGAGLAIGNSTPENRLVRFQIYSSATGGTAVYGEQQTVTISGGEFSVLIGNGQAVTGVSGPSNNTALATILSNMTNNSLYLGVSVAASGGNFTTEISPRQQLVAGAFAFRSKIAETVTNGGVTASMLATGAVTSDKIVNGALTSDKIAASAVTSDKINAGAITSNKIAAGAVTVDSITNASITSAKIASSTITSSNIDGNSVGLWSVTGSNIYRSSNVGIGTTSIGAPLTVQPSSTNNSPDANGIYVLNQAAGRNSVIATRVASGGGAPIYSMDIAGVAGWTMGIDPSDGQALKFGVAWDNPTGTNTRLTLDRSGNMRLLSGTTLYTSTIDLYSNGKLKSYMAGDDYWEIFGEGSSDSGSLIIRSGDNGNEPIIFRQQDSERMRIHSNGYVGIGTNNPNAPLHISGTGSSVSYWRNATGTGNGWSDTSYTSYSDAFSLIVSNGILADLIYLQSDERIKVIENFSDAEKDLETLLKIQITDFHYKDSVRNGSSKNKKVIAQQVEKVFPQAVRKLESPIPDIFAEAAITNGWVQLATNLSVGEKVKLFTKQGEIQAEVTAVRADGFQVDTDLKSGNVFVYGRIVKDFRAVDYDAISMLNVSATQQLNRDLETVAAESNDEFSKLRSELDAKSETIKQLESRLEKLEARLSNGN